MAASMAMVLLTVVVLHLSKYFIPLVVKQILKIVFQETQEEVKIKSQLSQLGEQQAEINVKEEFPKYARIDRKINKLKEDLKKLRQGKTAKTFTVSWGLTICLNVLQSFCFVFIIWRYRYEPMVVLNEDWFWPLSGLVSFPTGIPGAVGITCWILISNSILRRAETMIRTARVKSTSET